MASGVKGATKPAANTDTTLFTATQAIVVNVSACNQGGSANTTRISVVPSGGTAGVAHHIESDVSLASKGVIERTGIVLGTGDFIVVRSGGGDVSFACWGVDL